MLPSLDRYHLLNDIFSKGFGGVWEQLSPYMEKMVNAKSEEAHNQSVEKIHEVFRGQISILNKVDEISKS